MEGEARDEAGGGGRLASFEGSFAVAAEEEEREEEDRDGEEA